MARGNVIKSRRLNSLFLNLWLCFAFLTHFNFLSRRLVFNSLKLNHQANSSGYSTGQMEQGNSFNLPAMSTHYNNQHASGLQYESSSPNNRLFSSEFKRDHRTSLMNDEDEEDEDDDEENYKSINSEDHEPKVDLDGSKSLYKNLLPATSFQSPNKRQKLESTSPRATTHSPHLPMGAFHHQQYHAANLFSHNSVSHQLVSPLSLLPSHMSSLIQQQSNPSSSSSSSSSTSSSSSSSSSPSLIKQASKPKKKCDISNIESLIENKEDERLNTNSKSNMNTGDTSVGSLHASSASSSSSNSPFKTMLAAGAAPFDPSLLVGQNLPPHLLWYLYALSQQSQPTNSGSQDIDSLNSALPLPSLSNQTFESNDKNSSFKAARSFTSRNTHRIQPYNSVKTLSESCEDENSGSKLEVTPESDEVKREQVKEESIEHSRTEEDSEEYEEAAVGCDDESQDEHESEHESIPLKLENKGKHNTSQDTGESFNDENDSQSSTNSVSSSLSISSTSFNSSFLKKSKTEPALTN